MKKIIAGICFVCLFGLINSPVQAGIKGTIINFVENDSLLLFNPLMQSAVPLEAVKINKKGGFEFSYNPEAIGFYAIVLSNSKQVYVVLKPNETSQVDIDFVNGMIQNVRNSVENQLLKEFYDILLKYPAQSDGGQAAITQIRTLVSKYKKNYAACLILEYLQPLDNYLDVHAAVLYDLIQAYPKDNFVQNKYNELLSAKKLAIGYPAPEITLPDVNGKAVSLSSLRGKVVLIDFWASWCAPCRRENPAVVRLYNKYRERGFEIFGVSLDKDKQSWINAIQADGLTWTHVSDLKHWQSAAAAEYGVRGIPFTVLLDKDGNILAKGLRSHELEEILSKMFP